MWNWYREHYFGAVQVVKLLLLACCYWLRGIFELYDTWFSNDCWFYRSCNALPVCLITNENRMFMVFSWRLMYLWRFFLGVARGFLVWYEKKIKWLWNRPKRLSKSWWGVWEASQVSGSHCDYSLLWFELVLNVKLCYCIVLFSIGILTNLAHLLLYMHV